MRGKRFVLILFALLFIAVGCTPKETEPILPPYDPNEKVTLKVLYFNQDDLMEKYGNMFAAKYPNVELKAVDPIKDIMMLTEMSVDEIAMMYEEFLEDEKPDVIFGNVMLESMEKLAQRGWLLDLDPVIRQDGFDLEAYHENVLEAMRNLTGGKLHFLSPLFRSSALVYNRDLFDRYGIPYPQDEMTWQEILGLAERFKAADPKLIGIVHDEDAQSFILNAGSILHLQFEDVERKKVTINTKAWQDLWQWVTEAYRTGLIAQNPHPWPTRATDEAIKEYYSKHPLNAGETAMVIEGRSFLENVTVNWDVVSLPVFLDERNTGRYLLDEMFGIHAHSPHLRAAWEFVKFMNSDSVAKQRSKVNNQRSFASRTEYASEYDGRSLEAFYKLPPGDYLLRLNLDIPIAYRDKKNQLLSEAVADVLEERKTVNEALADLEQQLQTALEQALAEAEQ